MVGLRDRKPVHYCEASDDDEPRPFKRRSPGSSPDDSKHATGILKFTRKRTLPSGSPPAALGDVTNKQASADADAEAKGKTFARKTRGVKNKGSASPKRQQRSSGRQRAPVNYRCGCSHSCTLCCLVCDSSCAHCPCVGILPVTCAILHLCRVDHVDEDEELDERAGRTAAKPAKVADEQVSSDGDSDFERNDSGSKRKARGSGEHLSADFLIRTWYEQHADQPIAMATLFDSLQTPC